MSNLRFYHPEDLHIGANIKLSDNAATHATKVMRLNLGDSLALFCGDGFDYCCELSAIKKNEVLAQVKSHQKIEVESPLSITLLQGISGGDRMDIAIQKAVELGVTKIIPIRTERSVVKLDDEKAKKRVLHWQNVAIAACEQSGRAVVPKIDMPMALSFWLAEHPKATSSRILLNPMGAKKLSQLQKPQGEIQLFIGAEGGLSDKEIALASAHGFESVTLGARILRTETAPLAAIAAMNTLWGDF